MIIVEGEKLKIKGFAFLLVFSVFLFGCTNNTIIPLEEADGNTYYEDLMSNETSLIGTGTITEYLNSSDTVGLTYYEIIGDDDENN